MEFGERYYQLSRLGRDTFCASVAQASLVRATRPTLALGTESGVPRDSAPAVDLQLAMQAGSKFSSLGPRESSIIPLAKKPGTPFIDLVTLGRTDGNDIILADPSVSRFQAFFRRRHGRWFVCDAGSSNGTHVNGEKLQARTEAEVLSHTGLRFGTVEFLFYTSDSLYDVLTSRPALTARDTSRA